MSESQDSTIFDQLIVDLLNNVDDEDGCVRSVYDGDASYQIYKSIDGDLCWFISIDDEGYVISFGLNYPDVVDQSERYIKITNHTKEQESGDKDTYETVPTDPRLLN